MKSLLISGCIITIIALAPFSVTYATGSTVESASYHDKMPQKEKMTKDHKKMKTDHNKMKNMKGKSQNDMKDMPM